MATGICWIVFVCGVNLVIGINGDKDAAGTFLKPDEDVMDVTDFSIYYDLKTNETIKDMMPRPWYWPGWMLRLPFQGGPCMCENLECSCCVGIKVFNLNRKSCANLSFDPEQSTILMEVMMQNNSIYKNTFSARNPPPFCIPLPVPYVPPGLIDMCVRLYNITVMDQKLHACLDVDSRIDKSPVLVLHFDCIDMGAGGVSLSKPGGSLTPANEAMEPVQVDSDVYDPVTESTSASVKSLPLSEPWFNVLNLF